MCLFFFSSRRRHTRWPRDWSSDVCSSDLQLLELVKNALVGGHDELGVRQLLGCSDDLGGGTHVVGQIDDRSRRFGVHQHRSIGVDLLQVQDALGLELLVDDAVSISHEYIVSFLYAPLSHEVLCRNSP